MDLMGPEDIRQSDLSFRDFSNKSVKSACYAPFVSLFFRTTGEVQACCRNESLLLGNVREQRLRDIWHGPQAAKLREALTRYDFGLGCEYCEWELKSGNRQTAFRSLFDPFPVVSGQPEWPAVIDFVGSNTCNFECVMCWGELSSSIRGNRQGLPPLPKAYGDQFFEDLRDFLPHLQWMNFIGGEPFLMSEAYRTWDLMIADALSVACHVTTNGSQFNAKVERVLQALPMHLTVSLDGATKATFESIRLRSNFETVIANVHRFHAYTRQRGTRLNLAFCLMRQNWREFGEMLAFGDRMDCDVLVNTVLEPAHCSLFTLPVDDLRLVVADLQKQDAEMSRTLRRNRAVWDETLQKLRAATEKQQVQTLTVVLTADQTREDPLVSARRFAEAGEFQQALEQLQEISQQHRDYYFALSVAGYVRCLQGDLAGAEREVEAAFRMTRKMPDAYLNLARIRFKQGRLEDALAAASRARELVVPEDQREAELLLLLACLHFGEAPARTCEAFERLLELPPASRRGMMLPDSRRRARELAERAGLGKGSERLYMLFRLAQWRRGAHARNPIAPAGQAQGVDGGVRIADLDHSMPAWALRVSGSNKARLELVSNDSVRVVIEQANGGLTHEIQLNYPLDLAANRVYRVAFRLRADESRAVGLGVAKDKSPWNNLGLYRTIEATDSWLDIGEEFCVAVDEDEARVHFDLGGSAAAVEIEGFRIETADAVESPAPVPMSLGDSD
jgi:MoaA/NifB/PqqE/SkfB family radical SAM enzyme/tetratricopeptide (TPR) repeat protein